MALLTVAGIYKDGKVQLAETPDGTPDEAPVLVTFLHQSSASMPEDTTRAAAERMIARMRAGIDFGGRFDREELYDERLQRLAARNG